MVKATRTIHGWAKMPSGWVKEGKLQDFSLSQLGISITALKLYVSIVSAVRHVPTPESPGLGLVVLSYSELERRADIARGMIRPALSMLEPLVKTIRGGRVSAYEVSNYPQLREGGWAKIPWGYIEKNGIMRIFSARSRSSLSALKLYLVLLTFRMNEISEARVTYQTIAKYTGLPRNDIRAGTSRLIDAGLITLYSARDTGSDRDNMEYTCNRYKILGLW